MALVEKVEQLRHTGLWLLEHGNVSGAWDHDDFRVVDVACESLRVTRRQQRVLGAP
jgi:hypothetical protein